MSLPDFNTPSVVNILAAMHDNIGSAGHMKKELLI